MRHRDYDEYHIIPLRDLILHETKDCLCGPYTEQTPRNTWLYIHHSLDNRERNEQPLTRLRRIWRLVTRKELWREVLVNWDEDENEDD